MIDGPCVGQVVHRFFVPFALSVKWVALVVDSHGVQQQVEQSATYGRVLDESGNLTYSDADRVFVLFSYRHSAVPRVLS